MSCWPSQAQFSQLATRLSQPLINVAPIAKVCFDPFVDEEQCQVVHERFNDGLWRADQPGAAMNSNWEASDGMTTSCFAGNATYFAPSNGTCEQGRVPVVGVNATRPEDVQEAVKFASEHNLRLVVKNTGYAC